MSPRTAEQFEKLRTESKENIKKAALTLFSKNGFYNTKVSVIAKEAKISKGLMYNYFENKEKILEEILNDATKQGRVLIQQITASNEAPKDKLKFLVESTFKMMQEDFLYWKLLSMLSFHEDIVKKAEVHLRRSREYFISIQEKLFEEIGSKNPKIDTYLLGAILDGIFIQYVHMGKEYPLNEMKKYIIDKFLK